MTQFKNTQLENVYQVLRDMDNTLDCVSNKDFYVLPEAVQNELTELSRKLACLRATVKQLDKE